LLFSPLIPKTTFYYITFSFNYSISSYGTSFLSSFTAFIGFDDPSGINLVPYEDYDDYYPFSSLKNIKYIKNITKIINIPTNNKYYIYIYVL
jgi:predicted alpha/beta-fold hydrolase